VIELYVRPDLSIVSGFERIKPYASEQGVKAFYFDKKNDVFELKSAIVHF